MSKARNLSNLFSASTDMSTDAEVTSAISSHSSAADPHSVYLKESDFAASGKNKFLNADFSIWQRGSTFNSISPGAFTSDRWYHTWNGTGATRNVTRETFPSGTVLGGNNPQYFLRYNQSVAGTGGTYNVIVAQKIEDPRMFAGQTVTVSFWAKASTAISVPFVAYWTYLGSGSSGGNAGGGAYNLTMISENNTFSTSWTRYSYTFTMSSVSGVTFGSGAYGYFEIGGPLNLAFTADFWGFQIEQGPASTKFTTNAGDIASELTACKRYYERQSASSTQGYAPYATGYFNFATAAVYPYKYEVEKRVQPTLSFGPSANQFMAGYNGNQGQAANTITSSNISRHSCYITLVPNGTPFTSGQATTLQDGGSAVSYIEISAEL